MKKIGLVTLSLLGTVQVFAQSRENFKMILRDGWKMQSATRVTDAGVILSGPGYKTSDWYSVSVPTTVIAGFMGMNIKAPYSNDDPTIFWIVLALIGAIAVGTLVVLRLRRWL